MKNPFEILGIKEGASKDEVKKAYRKKALEAHPDKNPNDKKAADKFREINEAYESIKNGNYKKVEEFTWGPDIDIDEVFNFASKKFSGFFAKGKNVEIDMNININELIYGCIKEVYFQRQLKCFKCNGIGGEIGGICIVCKGHGKLRTNSNTPFGWLNNVVTCHACKGIGNEIINHCNDCNGIGVIQENDKLLVRVPAQYIFKTKKYTGLGSWLRTGQNGAYGDLIINIIEKDENFVRAGNNLCYELYISIAEAALGTKVIIPTLEKDTSLEIIINPGIQHGKILRIEGKGVLLSMKPNNIISIRRGDLIVTVNITIPVNMTAKERELMQTIKANEYFLT